MKKKLTKRQLLIFNMPYNLLMFLINVRMLDLFIEEATIDLTADLSSKHINLNTFATWSTTSQGYLFWYTVRDRYIDYIISKRKKEWFTYIEDYISREKERLSI